MTRKSKHYRAHHDMGGPMRAVIYIRVSTKDQATNLSLPTQERECREVCRRNGWEVVRVFVDAGQSAKSTDRAAFQQMLQFCAAHPGRIGAVVVYALSRFSRNVGDHTAVQAVLRANGIRLRSATEPLDESSEGRLMETMFAALAQYDNDKRADRTRAGMKARVRLGGWPFKRPVGYRKDGAQRLIPDPEVAPLVRAAFELYATGCYTKRQVLDRVTALGLRSYKGAPMSSQVFDGLLTNRLYAGWLVVPE